MIEAEGSPEHVQKTLESYMMRKTMLSAVWAVSFSLVACASILTCGWSPRCNPDEAPAPPSAPAAP